MPGQPIDLPLPPGLIETFGHLGDARYVGFHWSPCGDELVFDDGFNSGTGQSQSFLIFRRHPAVAPLLAGYNLGYSDSNAEHWLLIDREGSRATIAAPAEARAFLEKHVPLSVEEQEEIVGQLDEFLMHGWEEVHIDPEEVRKAMDEQRGRVGRMVSWLDMCPKPPQKGFTHD